MPEPLRPNQHQVNQAALKWLTKTAPWIDPQRQYLLQLMEWGLDHLRPDLDKKLLPLLEHDLQGLKEHANQEDVLQYLLRPLQPKADDLNRLGPPEDAAPDAPDLLQPQDLNQARNLQEAALISLRLLNEKHLERQ